MCTQARELAPPINYICICARLRASYYISSILLCAVKVFVCTQLDWRKLLGYHVVRQLFFYPLKLDGESDCEASLFMV